MWNGVLFSVNKCYPQLLLISSTLNITAEASSYLIDNNAKAPVHYFFASDRVN